MHTYNDGELARDVACLGGSHSYLSRAVITGLSLLRWIAYLPSYVYGCRLGLQHV